MDRNTVVIGSSLAALAIYAVIGRSAVMLVSLIAIALMLYLLRHARLRDRVIAVFAAALGGGLAAAIVRTVFYHLRAGGPGAAESGSLFMSAIQVGVINALVVVVMLFIARAWFQ
jgi:hypothetical protein